MATYRFEAKIIGRSQGRSATASAAYRASERIDDTRTGQTFDYTRKGGVLHKEILAPAGTPDWMRDRAQLWNAVEKVEKRKDAQLARDLVVSLPHELTHAQRRELVREFVKAEFVSRGMIADIAIHKPDRRGDGRNHHAHVMLTMRELTAAGFGNKARAWNEGDLLDQWRFRWAEHVNQSLERHGHEARVDHRSLADQGIDREPEPKLGPVATKMEREGRPSNAGDDRRAAMARNEERTEIAEQLHDVTAELIDLEQERLKRAPSSGRLQSGGERPGERDDMAEDDRARTGRAALMADGGLVAQQRDANARFEANSRALQERQAKTPEQDNAPAKDPAADRPTEARDATSTDAPSAPPTAQSQDQSGSLETTQREDMRRFRADMAHSFEDGDKDRPAAETRDQKKDTDKDKEQARAELSDREKLRQFKEQMSRSFTRDDPGDRTR